MVIGVNVRTIRESSPVRQGVGLWDLTQSSARGPVCYRRSSLETRRPLKDPGTPSRTVHPVLETPSSEILYPQTDYMVRLR